MLYNPLTCYLFTFEKNTAGNINISFVFDFAFGESGDFDFEMEKEGSHDNSLLLTPPKKRKKEESECIIHCYTGGDLKYKKITDVSLERLKEAR